MKKSTTVIILFFVLALFMGIDAPPSIEVEQPFATSPESDEIPEMIELDQFRVADDPQIVITMNSDFVDQSWPGAGTAENPYKIENLTINDPDTCIYIEDTDVHFRIRNCTFSGNDWNTYGVRMNNVTNGVIDSCIMSEIRGGISGSDLVDVSINNCTITLCEFTGVYVQGDNCTIQNNTISLIDNGNGIFISYSYNVSVVSNLLTDTSFGLVLAQSTQCNITENEFVNDGLIISDIIDNVNYWHHQISNNTVNDRDLGYFWNATNSIIDGDFGSLILANCTNVTIVDSAMQNVNVGIQLGYSSDCKIVNATLTNHEVGIFNIRSSNTTISSLTSSCTEYDVFTTNSPYLLLANSTLYSGGYGVHGVDSESSQIINNTISSSVGAINMLFCDDLLVDNNTLDGYCMSIQSSDRISIFNNTIISNQYDGIDFYTCLDMNIIDNEFHGCGLNLGGAISYWDHEIHNNTVNEEPLLYYWGISNQTIESVSCNQVIFANCFNISVSDLSISNTSIGIQAAFSSNITLSDIRVTDCVTGIYVYEAVDANASDITLEGCNTGIDVLLTDNSTISNVNATGNLDGISVGGCFNITLLNCSIFGSDDDGFEIGDSDVVWIENCTSQHCDDGIYTDYCQNLTIIDSKFLNNDRGCVLDGGEFLTMINNTVSWNHDGVQLWSCDNSNITFNTISDNGADGLRIRYSDNCTVSNNTLDRNWECLKLSDVNLIGVFNNSLSDNGYGLILDDAYNVSFIDNLVYLNSERGITVDWDSVNNTFYSNRIGGGVDGNALDNGVSNYWDNGIDTGNAWSDYSGSPTYIIAGSAGSIDHYPTLFEDNAAPVIDHPDDIAYELGTTTYISLTWYPNDLSPESYEIYRDDIQIQIDVWDGGSIDVNVGGQSYGVHNYTLKVTDSNGLSATDTVLVNVWATPGSLVVESNSDFVTRGFLGSGTLANPYVLSDLTLKLNGTCVYIFGTDAYFAISNFNISSDGISEGYGIILSNVDHGTISFSSISGKVTGIYASNADYCSIIGNEVYGNSISGIYLDTSSYANTLTSNVVHDNSWMGSLMGGPLAGGGITVGSRTDIIGNFVYDNDLAGIFVSSSSSCVITGNTLVGNGFFVYYSHAFSQNTVNGKAFDYLVGLSDTTIDGSSYGQLYLQFCTGVTILDAEFNDATIGIWMENCMDCVIDNSSFSFNSLIGAVLMESSNCTIRNSKVYGNERMGIYSGGSEFINLTQNAVVGNAYTPEFMSQSGGITIVSSDNVTISNNLVFNNTLYGIITSSSEGGHMIGNSIGSNNGTGATLLHGVSEWKMYNNKIGWNSPYNAFDSWNDNIWDDGQGQGNYWSDYSGTGTYPIPASYYVDDRYPSLLTDSGSPTLSTISDFEYELEYTPLILEWDVSDENPASFMLYRNGSLVDYGAWTNGQLQLEVHNSNPGVHEFTLVIYDLAMNMINDSVIITMTDTAAPEWSTIPQSQIVELGFNLMYQILAIDNHRIDHYWINDTVTFSIDSNGIITNELSLEVGTYGISIEAHDSSGHFISAEISVLVQDTTGPIWVQTPVDQQIMEEHPFRYDLNATDRSGVESWSINDTSRFTIDPNGVITNLVYLAPGTYSVLVTVSDTFGNTRVAEFTITVNQASGIPTVTTTTTTTNNTTTTTQTTIPPPDPVTLSFAMVGGIIGIIIVAVYIGRRKGRI